MTIKVTVPELGESVVAATVGEWHKQAGDLVAVGDTLVDLETDKVDIEVSASAAGVLVEIKHEQGEDVEIGDTLAIIDDSASPDNGSAATDSDSATAPAEDDAPTPQPPAAEENEETAETKPAEMEGMQTETLEAATAVSSAATASVATASVATPIAQRLAQERGVDLAQVKGSGANSRITRQDVEAHVQQRETEPAREPETASPAPARRETAENGRFEERIRLSRRRRTIAQRLVTAQQTAAMLTTFNDVDMSAVIALRQRRGPAFQERHNVKLGFMSFFVKGVVSALKAFPRLNAEIDGDEVVIKHYYDMGIAVGAEEGLVVPVVRDADRRSFADIEQEIRGLAQKAQDGSLTLEDLRGGTFTITNGGIFGSLLSTPILNTPQVGILGMHRIEERPIALNGEVVIRPMMYLALSYDHRLIDGREAVLFLSRLKELIEDPETLLLEG